jgi:hypothetical protein
MDISTIDTSVPRARQLRDESQSGRYPTRGYHQRQPSLERGAADQTDLKHDEHGKSALRKELTTMRRERYAQLTDNSDINVQVSSTARITDFWKLSTISRKEDALVIDLGRTSHHSSISDLSGCSDLTH